MPISHKIWKWGGTETRAVCQLHLVFGRRLVMTAAYNIMVCFAGRAADGAPIVALAIAYLGRIPQVLSLAAIAKVSSTIFSNLSTTELSSWSPGISLTVMYTA